MLQRARAKMIASINAVSGRADCSEAVLLQQRPVWAIVVGGVIFAIAMLLLPRELGTIVRGAIAGGGIGLVLALTTTSVLVGRCGDQVVVATPSRWQPTVAKELRSVVDAPVKGSVNSGFISKKVTFLGDDYLVHKALEDRFRSVIR